MSSTPVSLPVLHPRFRPEATYRAMAPYRLLPFRFIALDERRSVLTNLAGEHFVVLKEAVPAIINGKVRPNDALYDALVSRHFIADGRGESSLDLLAVKYATRHSRLADFTALHIFVVTLRCDHSCPYCQVSRVSEDRAAFDMTTATASRALDLVFRSPSPHIKIEFQGGEPLLNFDLIRSVVEHAKSINQKASRDLAFVIATNLSPLTDEMLDFCKCHDIAISTSIDGPRELHNANRPRLGDNAHQNAEDGIRRCREVLGDDRVSALMTTTARTLEQPEAVIDEYVRLGFPSVFLRWLSPFGFATKTGRVLGYPTETWSRFYERGLRYILSLNKRNVPIREDYASIVLRKMLTPYPTPYVDLQSPAGLGIAAAVYNYDGDVYASDEGRMLAEMDDPSLRLGNVHHDTYRDIFLSDRLIELLDNTMTDATPMCADCAFEPYCGTDPAFHLATQGDATGARPTSLFCARNMDVFRLLIRMLQDEPESAKVLKRWV